LPSGKQLLKALSVRAAGKAHHCRSSATHKFAKGDLMLVLKEGQDERHYCVACARKFLLVARDRIAVLETELG